LLRGQQDKADRSERIRSGFKKGMRRGKGFASGSGTTPEPEANLYGMWNYSESVIVNLRNAVSNYTHRALVT